MDVDFQERAGGLVVTPLGERLDAQAAPGFRQTVSERVAGKPLVVLALERVSFMDSSGLAALISILKRVATGGQVRLAGVSPAVASLLKLTRMERVFPVFDTVDAALRG
jgi:anti-sigma B factor antagonist